MVVHLASADPWSGRAAIGNDAFTSVSPPLPDDGFTNDLALAIEHRDDDLTLGGSIFHRMITAEDYTRRRWDELDLRATLRWQWRPDVAFGAWLGPSFGGDWGGLWIQNTWHGVSGTGPTVDQGLPNVYPGGRTVAVVAGERTRATIDTGVGEHGGVGAYGDVAAQVAIGDTGVTLVDAAGGVRARYRWFSAHAELAVTRYHVMDPYLALPGGYRPGWQLEWRVGLELAWSRYRVSYEYRANEGGSGEPIGVIAFAW